MWYNEVGDKMNTIIVDRILMHMMDFEHREIIFSDDFLELSPTMQEYYDKKIEKAWTSPQLKEITLGDFAPIILRSKDMIEDIEKYFKHARSITEELFNLGSLIQLMPNCNIIFMECKINGMKHMAIIKLNYKIAPVNVIDEDENGNKAIRITNRQMVPTKSASVEEAIIVNTEENRVFIIEKRFEIDGKLDYYLNAQYLKGEPKMTDKQKVSLLNKTITKVESQFGVNEFEPKALIKKEMVNCVLENKEIKPHEIAEHLLERDYNAKEECIDLLIDLGIDETMTISSNFESVEKMSKCKIVTDTDIEITLNVADYLEETNIRKVKNEDGTYSIILDDIRDIVVK